MTIELELEHYGGCGWMNIYTKNKKIVIKWGAHDEEKVFYNAEKAIKFYDSLKCNKAAWLISPSGLSELIDCHIIKRK